MLEHVEPSRTAPAFAQAALGRAGGAGAIDPDEKIGIGRIKLRQPRHGVSAVVGGFFEAERLLVDWKCAAHEPTDCEFVIAFTDGAMLRGVLRLWSKQRARPALWTTIHKMLRARDGALINQHGRSVDESILDCYALDRLPYEPARARARTR